MFITFPKRYSLAIFSSKSCSGAVLSASLPKIALTRGVAPLSTGRGVVAGCAALLADSLAGCAALLADPLAGCAALLAHPLAGCAALLAESLHATAEGGAFVARVSG